MSNSIIVFIISLLLTVPVSADTFKEVTIGLPVSSLNEAERWYSQFIGAEVEMIRPAEGIAEFKIAPGVWLQLFVVDHKESANSVIRFSVDDFVSAQQIRSVVGIKTGEAITIPDVVTFSEFNDPFGNALGFYSVP